MNQKTNLQAVGACIDANVPFLWVGPPGVGKTEMMHQVTADRHIHLETYIASLHEPSDIGGLPILRAGGVELESPSWAKRLGSLEPPHDGRVRGIIFFDEFNCAPPSCQAGVLRILAERVVGDTALPNWILPCAAMNPTDQAANGYDLAASTANRFCQLMFKIDPLGWIDWALQQVKKIPAINLFAGFVKMRPHLLFAMPQNEAERSGPWASPRSITMAAKLYSVVPEGGTDDLRMELVAGCVGEGWALEFLNWLKQLDLPDPEELLKSPGKFQLSARGDVQFAVLTSVSGAALRNLTKERWLAAWEILGRAADQGGADIAASAARPLVEQLAGNSQLPTKHIGARFVPLIKATGRMIA